MNMRNYYTAILFLVSVVCFSQTRSVWEASNAAEITQAYQKAYNWFMSTGSYAFKMKYTSYKDHLSNNVKETSVGFCKRRQNKFRSEALGTIMIQCDNYKLMIDTVDKQVMVTNPDKQAPAMASVKDIQELLKNTKMLKKMKGDNHTRYRIEFNKNALYEAYEFTVNEQGYLEGLVYFYSEQKEEYYENEQSEKPVEIKSKPRLEIVFSAFEIPAKTSDADFADKNIQVNSSKKITLLNKYRAYTLKDYRYEQHN